MTRQRELPRASLRRVERGEIRSAFGRLGAALVFPNTYWVGMSNLAVHVLYRLINMHPAFWCDRAFVWADERAVTLETERSLADFDLLAFSLSYELDEANAVALLQRAGIPPRAADRDARHPLILAGGVAASLNPEPMAPFVDVFLLGEVEETLPKLLDAVAETPSREALFNALGGIEGAYAPTLQAVPPTPACVEELDAYPTTSVILTPQTEFADRFLIEISRGCMRGCRFCATRGLYGKARLRSVEAILDAARRGLTLTDRIGLVGATITDHPEADRVLSALRTLGAKVSVSSFQADRASDTMLECLAAGGQRTVTIAPEAGTERLRRQLGKTILDADIVRCAEAARRADLRFVKLYFMIGLPDEQEDDLAAIPRLVKQTARFLPTKVALTPFVPKWFTPLADAPVVPRSELQRRLRGLRQALRRIGRVTVTAESVDDALAEAVLSRGGRELADLLEQGRRVLRREASRWLDLS